jgi:hypothetical protein
MRTKEEIKAERGELLEAFYQATLSGDRNEQAYNNHLLRCNTEEIGEHNHDKPTNS